MKRKEIIREIISFAGVLFVILCALNAWVDREINSHYELLFGEMLAPKDPSPLVILGSSKSGESVNPKDLEEIGLKAANFSADSSDPIFYDKWYHELFLKHYPKPRVIVYCVDWILFNDKGRFYEYDSEFFPFLYFLQKLFDPSLNRFRLLSNRFPLFKYRLFIFKLLTRRYSYAPYRMQDFYKGYIPVDGVGDLLKVKVAGVDETDPRYLRAFERLLDEWQADGIKVIFAQTPDYIPGRESAHLEANMKFLHDLADQRGIPFLDYNGELASPLNFDKKVFKDWTHLNFEGSKKFSPLFARDLKKVLIKKKWM